MPSTQCLVPSTQCLVPSTQSLVPRIQCPVLCTQYPVPELIPAHSPRLSVGHPNLMPGLPPVPGWHPLHTSELLPTYSTGGSDTCPAVHHLFRGLGPTQALQFQPTFWIYWTASVPSAQSPRLLLCSAEHPPLSRAPAGRAQRVPLLCGLGCGPPASL